MRPINANISSNNNKMALTGFNNLHVFWCTKEYDEDHIGVLLQREDHRMEFHFQSPQISDRGRLVDWMKEIAVNKNLDHFSIHLAVYLLDVFMDNYNIVQDKLQLIALVCLLLATKFEERDCNILKSNDVNELVQNKYSINDYYGLEILILKHLKWNLLLPTTVHFVHSYIEFLFSKDDFQETKFNSETELWLEARCIIQNYLDYVMEDLNLMHEKPSMVGAAIMAVTRKHFRFAKKWPQQLHSITGYKLFELKPVILRLRIIASNNNH